MKMGKKKGKIVHFENALAVDVNTGLQNKFFHKMNSF